MEPVYHIPIIYASVNSQGTPCPNLRDNFVVFDSSCIRVCIDDKNDFMVNPYGFDVFQGLVDIIAKVKSLLEAEIRRRQPNLTLLRIDGSSSSVAVLLNNLGKDTDLIELKKLGTFGPQEEKLLTELTVKFEDLVKKDKSELLREKRTIGRDIKSVIGKLNAVSATAESDAYIKGSEVLQGIKKLRDIALVHCYKSFLSVL